MPRASTRAESKLSFRDPAGSQSCLFLKQDKGSLSRGTDHQEGEHLLGAKWQEFFKAFSVHDII